MATPILTTALRFLFVGCIFFGLGGLPAFAATWTVSTASQLDNAWRNAAAGDEIVVNPGTYNLIASVILRVNNLTLRGSTGNRDDVVLVGGGMNTQGVNEGVIIESDFVTVKDLTVKDFYWNGIHVRAENDADSPVIRNVKTWNIGERHIKGSWNSADPNAVIDNLLIENCYMLQTIPRSGHSETGPDYIGGIVMMSLRNPIIRDNTAEGIVGSTNGGNAAIFLWQGIENATVERNRIYGCAKGIAYGNPFLPIEPNRITGDWHASGGIIRNNFHRRGTWTGGNNIGIELANTKNVTVAHNTVYSDDASYFRTVSITDSVQGRGNTTGVVLAYNVVRGALYTSTFNGGWTSTGDIFDTAGTTVVSGWFVNTATADLHLTSSATGAIDQAATLASVTDDYDKQARPIGPAPDKGADEFGTGGGLPSPWLTQDIGAVGATGSASYSSGTFTVVGSGADIWGTADEFRFVYQTASGNCEITARVASVQNVNGWSKAGVMIRNTLNANSKHAMVVVTPSNGVAFQRRTSTGGTSASTQTTGLVAPYWVRVVRSGSTFTGYRSPDGVTWTSMGSVTISMASNVYIGLAVTSHLDGTLCTSTMNNVTVVP